MKYLAVLGRQPEVSIAELNAILAGILAEPIFSDAGLEFSSTSYAGRPGESALKGSSLGAGRNIRVENSNQTFMHPKKQVSAIPAYITFSFDSELDIARLGGTQKLAVELEMKPLAYLKDLPEGKITIGVSDYSKGASRSSAQREALKLKKILVRHGRSVRVVESKDVVLSNATSLHNGLSGKNPRKVELIKTDDGWYRVIGVQDIDAYAKRDQARPARDAKVGMLPPKLAQILINLCGPLEPGSTVLDPFCGTGVLLQEALLMGYRAYGTDINERMIDYAKKNLDWLSDAHILSGTRVARARRHGARALILGRNLRNVPKSSVASLEKSGNNLFELAHGDATSFRWSQPIDAVACEGYLGKPMSQIPTEMALKEQKQECGSIVVGFLKNLHGQIESGTPVTIAVPAWLREDNTYSRLDILDLIDDMGYNVNNKTREGLLYHRDGQIVARDILILRKK